MQIKSSKFIIIIIIIYYRSDPILWSVTFTKLDGSAAKAFRISKSDPIFKNDIEIDCKDEQGLSVFLLFPFSFK